MMVNEEILKEMDKAATEAAEQLEEISKDHIIVVADWWKKNYLKAGHKRLAKLLLACASK